MRANDGAQYVNTNYHRELQPRAEIFSGIFETYRWNEARRVFFTLLKLRRGSSCEELRPSRSSCTPTALSVPVYILTRYFEAGLFKKRSKGLPKIAVPSLRASSKHHRVFSPSKHPFRSLQTKFWKFSTPEARFASAAIQFISFRPSSDAHFVQTSRIHRDNQLSHARPTFGRKKEVDGLIRRA